MQIERFERPIDIVIPNEDLQKWWERTENGIESIELLYAEFKDPLFENILTTATADEEFFRFKTSFGLRKRADDRYPFLAGQSIVQKVAGKRYTFKTSENYSLNPREYYYFPLTANFTGDLDLLIGIFGEQPPGMNSRFISNITVETDKLKRGGVTTEDLSDRFNSYLDGLRRAVNGTFDIAQVVLKSDIISELFLKPGSIQISI